MYSGAREWGRENDRPCAAFSTVAAQPDHSYRVEEGQRQRYHPTVIRRSMWQCKPTTANHCHQRVHMHASQHANPPARWLEQLAKRLYTKPSKLDLVLCCETRSCHACRHNDLEEHSNFTFIYSFSILYLEHHYCGDQQWRSL